ncbi:MAG TPA: SpoIID/LytB domain-containing protein [Gaiellaceae bacterium]
MPRRLTLLALAIALLAGGAASAQPGRKAAAPAPTPLFVVTGHGWGHGVGMGQYGALGYAQHGYGYARILAHYYPGTTLATAPPRRVRVLLTQGRAKLTISSTVAFRVTDADGTSYPLAPGDVTLGPKLKVKVQDPAQPEPVARALTGPIVFAPGTQPLELGKPYRGQIAVSVVDGKLRAINVVALEAYLNAVVPSEMPHRWLPEALKAQAVAARSYALSHLQTGAFDLFPDVRSQVYGGVRAEQPETSSAVQATAGQVLTYGGRVAQTFFFSTSGGRTLSAEDAWGKPIPYLVSVPDPYDSISPYHDWGPFSFTAAKLAKALKSPGRLLDVQTTQNGSGRVAEVMAVGADGESTTEAAKVRRALGLRSTWFTVGVVGLSAPAAPGSIVFGAAAQLTGIARNATGAAVEQRPAGSSVWAPLAAIPAPKDGAFAFTVKPKITTSYRVAMGAARTQPVRLPVAPLVRFYPLRAAATELRGLVRPVLPGARVDVQRLDGTAWKTMKRVQVDDKGDFDASLQLARGSYRARATPGRGFVPGTTRVLEVVNG